METYTFALPPELLPPVFDPAPIEEKGDNAHYSEYTLHTDVLWVIYQTVDDQQGTVFTKEVTSNKCPDKCLCIILHTFHEVTHKFTPSVINHLKYPRSFPIN